MGGGGNEKKKEKGADEKKKKRKHRIATGGHIGVKTGKTANER